MRQELTVLIISALPVMELRASIPLAIGIFHFLPGKALLLALIGNLIPIPFLLALMPRALRLAEMRAPRLHVFLEKKLRSLENEHAKSYQRFGSFALALLVAIPLPGTGIWTGSVLAVLFDIKLKYAVPALILGDVVAGLLVLLATTGVIKVILL